MVEKPDNTIMIAEGQASLYRGDAWIGQTACDHMVIQPLRGIPKKVIIYYQDGKRRAGLIKLRINLHVSRPGGPVSHDYQDGFENVSPEHEKRLLAVYDKFPKTT